MKKQPYNTKRSITLKKSKFGGLVDLPIIIELEDVKDDKKLLFSKDEFGKVKYEHQKDKYEKNLFHVTIPKVYKNKDTVFYVHY